MEEIIEGVFHWKAVHPNTGSEASCHFVASSGTAIDPLLPDEGIEWFDGRRVERIVLSTRHHLRQAPEIAKRFDCPILCHESGLYEFEDGPAVEGFAFGDRLADDIVALEMDSTHPTTRCCASSRAAERCSSPTASSTAARSASSPTA